MEGFTFFLFLAVIIFVLSGIKIINQYERGVVLTLGRYTGIRQPRSEEHTSELQSH